MCFLVISRYASISQILTEKGGEGTFDFKPLRVTFNLFWAQGEGFCIRGGSDENSAGI
jgi:hypothetical protein